MPAANEREDLFQEIMNALRQWPELERRIFSQAHYFGKSVDAISGSLGLNSEEVTSILKNCDRRLHDSLRSFRRVGGENAPDILSSEKSRPAA